jgi:serine/threonine protein kinase
LAGDGYGKAVDMWSLGVLAYALCARAPRLAASASRASRLASLVCLTDPSAAARRLARPPRRAQRLR